MMGASYAPPVRLVDAGFSNVESLRVAVRAWDLDFKPLARPSLPTEGIGHVTQIRLGPVDLGYARFAVSLDQQGAPPPGRLTFVVPSARMGRLWWRGRDVEPGSVLVFPVGSDLRAFSGPDFEVTTISADEEAILPLGDRLGFATVRPAGRLETIHLSRHTLADVRRSLEAVRNPALGTGANLPDVIEGIAAAWLRGAGSGPQKRPSLRARDLAVRRCLEAIEGHDHVDLTTGRLCELARVSERTLQYAFRERFGLTPAAFLKASRLAAVRRRLQRPEALHDTVGDVAGTLGFWHVGQFATDYRRAFGEPPSATLNRAKALL